MFDRWPQRGWIVARMSRFIRSNEYSSRTISRPALPRAAARAGSRMSERHRSAQSLGRVATSTCVPAAILGWNPASANSDTTRPLPYANPSSTLIRVPPPLKIGAMTTDAASYSLARLSTKPVASTPFAAYSRKKSEHAGSGLGRVRDGEASERRAKRLRDYLLASRPNSFQHTWLRSWKSNGASSSRPTAALVAVRWDRSDDIVN